MYTETLLWTLGENARRAGAPVPGNGSTSPASSTAESAELGIAEVKSFLTSIGVPADGIIQYDGSGLSRHNLITPSAVVQLYTHMAKQSKYSQAWRDSLTIGGVDGTLRNRFKGTAAAGNIRGKTGTIDQVSALSGYLTTAGGEQLVLSIVVNGVARTSDRTGLIDDVVLELANYKGRIDN
jgi:D-alanyl-D-alanine carboxypeptidase/D-alanyl-D-alanine-endopeptidase (penicillin-binding protein 4)